MNKGAVIPLVAIFLMCIVVVFYYLWASGRPGRIVIPAGNTYLGPNDPSKIQ